MLSEVERVCLSGVARRSVESGLRGDGPLEIEPSGQPPPLQELRGAFITLRLADELRGCVGVVEPRLPLVCCVAHCAHSAAFDDPRFGPLERHELSELGFLLSVLSPLEPIAVDSRADLVAQLRPGRDGLLLRQGYRQATFLPSVWETVEAPGEFVAALERKCGLTATDWLRPVECLRYQTEEWTG